MFQFPGFACNLYEFKATYLLLITIIPKPTHSLHECSSLGMIVIEGGFPHSEIRGSKLVRSSPRLIAAYHVLHRLSAPRHPPNTLKALDCSHRRCPPRPSVSTESLEIGHRSERPANFMDTFVIAAASMRPRPFQERRLRHLFTI
jgi:hypothetical protein